MNIKQTLQDLNDYFVKEIIEGDFDLIHLDHIAAEVLTHSGGSFRFLYQEIKVPYGKEEEKEPVEYSVVMSASHLHTMKLELTQRQQDILWLLFSGAWRHKEKEVLLANRQEIDEKLSKLDNQF